MLITSCECMTKPQNVRLRFSYFFLLMLKHDFKPFGSFLGLEEKMVKISMKKLFFSRMLSENQTIDPPQHIPEARNCKSVMW